MELTTNKLKSLIREEMQRVPNFQRMGRFDHWQDYTDLYNMNYRKFHEGNGFKEVQYNEPSNIVLMRPEEGTFSKDTPVALFGVKKAQGIYEDMRHIDSTSYGIKPVKLSEDEWNLFMENTYKAIQETNPIYLMNFGMMDPTMDLDPQDQDEFNRRKTLSRTLSYNASGS